MKWVCALTLLLCVWMPPTQAKETVTLYVTNAQGTIVATMDVHGHVTYTAAYRPYGKQQTGAPKSGPGYTGHVNDPDTGLVYMQARYYDPTGRFLSVDPVSPTPGDIFNFNRYAYANDNPVMNVDPSGKTCTENNGKYECHIDAVVYKNGKKVKRADFSHHLKQLVKKFNKNYTKSVNFLAKHPNKSVKVSIPGSGSSQTVTSGFVAKTLAKRTMIAEDFSGHGIGAQTPLLQAKTTYLYREALFGKNIDGLNVNDRDKLISIMLAHEGMHGTYVDKTQGAMSIHDFNSAHQKPYDTASMQLLGISGD